MPPPFSGASGSRVGTPRARWNNAEHGWKEPERSLETGDRPLEERAPRLESLPHRESLSFSHRLGTVAVQADSLAGPGIIAGATAIGTESGAGAFLAPGMGASKPATLTIQSALTFQAYGSYTYKLNTKKAKADQVIANGVTVVNGARFKFSAVANKRLAAGKTFTAISNTSATPINGTFANLTDGSTFTAGRNTFQATTPAATATTSPSPSFPSRRRKDRLCGRIASILRELDLRRTSSPPVNW